MPGEEEHVEERRAQSVRESVVSTLGDVLAPVPGTGEVADAVGRGLSAAGGALEAATQMATDGLGDLARGAAGVAGAAAKGALEVAGTVELGELASAAGEVAGEVLGAAGDAAGAVLDGLGSLSP